MRVLDSACWPTRHVGRWHGFVTTSPYYHYWFEAPLEYPSGEMLLEVSEHKEQKQYEKMVDEVLKRQNQFQESMTTLIEAYENEIARLKAAAE